MPGDAAARGVLEPELTPASLEKARFHALDRVRAVAMLLGVVYHTLLFRMFTGGGGPPGSMSQLSASKLLGDWLHSFRMPLFFLIAGFFGRMMLLKYGTGEFLRRRAWRIGLTLVISMFTFGPIYILTRDLTSRPPSFGPGPGRMGPPGARPGPPGEAAEAPGPPAFRRLDEGGNPPGGGPREFAGRPGPGPGGPPGGPGGFRPGGGPPGFGPPGGGGVAERIFGPYTRFVQLNHLWFLWYLLVFVVVAPFLTRGLALVWPKRRNDDGDRLGLEAVGWGFAPLFLAIASTPALLMTRPMFGWFLGLAPAIFRAFPDFLYQFDADMLFYFAYFLAGWWLERERLALPGVARTWLPNLLIGLGAFGIAIGLERQARDGSDPMALMSSGGNIKVIAYAIYCLGSACTCFAFLGIFLRFLDYPSRTWRYLADTALWVYLIHQPLVLIGLALARPLGLPWWALTAGVSAFTVACCLLLYEAIVRPTPLVRLFGPASAKRSP